MKQIVLLLGTLTTTFALTHAQNTFPATGASGIGTTAPHSSSLLEIKSTTRGLLMPRMTKAQRDAIASPATGLMIYQNSTPAGFYYYNGTAWTALKDTAGAETDPQVGANATNFIPRWNGSALVAGLIQDNGNRLGINKAPDTEHRFTALRQAATGSLFSTIYSAIRGENNASGSATINSVGYLGVNNPAGMYPIVFPSPSVDDIGVLGIKRGNATEGAAVYGWNQGGAGSNYGVFGVASSSSGINYSVYGKTSATNSGINYGVYANVEGAAGNYGVYGKVVTRSGQFGYGVFGSASGPGTSYAGFFSGNVYVGGDNDAVTVAGTNPYIQMKSGGNNIGYLRANVTDLEIATNAGNVGNLVLRTNGGDRMIVGSNGRVAINTLITPAQFNVYGTNEVINIDGTNPYLQLNASAKNIGYLRARDGNLQLSVNSSNTAGKLQFLTANKARMWIDNNGAVSISDDGKTANGYLLSVKGKAAAEEVLVQLNGNWPDYVFADNYQLKTLPELKHYIQTNNHLPDVPAAAEMKAGIALGNMNKLLMQKVEELTLYVLQLHEELENIKQQNK